MVIHNMREWAATQHNTKASNSSVVIYCCYIWLLSTVNCTDVCKLEDYDNYKAKLRMSNCSACVYITVLLSL
jgi:hypothetical protein